MNDPYDEISAATDILTHEVDHYLDSFDRLLDLTDGFAGQPLTDTLIFQLLEAMGADYIVIPNPNYPNSYQIQTTNIQGWAATLAITDLVNWKV